ncbi:MAG: hypothetical protein DDT23_01124 [candidate division WS2 bacterium]|nr:hypothetical protein [Candidatus Lithacetigena glycinireducens]
MQTRKHSFVESITNVIVGYIVAVLSQLAIFPFFNIHIPLSDNFIIGFWFTIISLVRSYCIRRIFNSKIYLSNPKKQVVYRVKRW